MTGPLIRGIEHASETIRPRRDGGDRRSPFPPPPKPARRCARSARRPSIRSPRSSRSAIARANPRARHADHRIDRHRRRHEAVLRRRRRALPRRRECLAPDEGVGSQAVRRQRRHRRSPRSRSASTASPSRPPRARRLPNVTTARHLSGARQDAVRQAQPGQDLEGRQRQAAGASDPRLRPAADQRHARRARRADHDPAVRSQPGMAALKKSRRGQVQGDLHRRCARTAPTSRPARTTI